MRACSVRGAHACVLAALTAPFCHRPPVESIRALICAGAMPKRVGMPNISPAETHARAVRRTRTRTYVRHPGRTTVVLGDVRSRRNLVLLADARRSHLGQHLVRERLFDTEKRDLAADGLEALLHLERHGADVAVHAVVYDTDLRA